MKKEQYKYYSTHRPVDIGAYPKPPDNPMTSFLNFDDRRPVEGGAFLAWGELTYEKPLTDRELYNYELRPSRENPDVRRTMDEQAQVVGAWEVKNHIPETKRLTWWYSDFGAYVPGDSVTPEQLAERYRFAKKFPKLRGHADKQQKPPHHEGR